MDVSDDSMLCRKCRHMCETKSTRDSICNSPEPNKIQKTLSKQSIKSPPTVTLSIPSTSTSHANCVICKKPGPKLVVVPENTRVNVFIQKETFVPPGSRCCPKHISDGDLNTEALHLLKQTSSVSNVNRTTIVGVLKQTRDVAIQNQNKRLNFDDPHGMQNEDYYNLTGVTKDQFDELMTYLVETNLRSSKNRSTRTCVALLLTKLRCGLSNQLLGTLFGMKKWQVRRAVISAKNALMEDFVPKHLGFSHISREDVINHHTRPLAKELLCSMSDNPVILVLDGTYVYLQKSGNFSFSRRSYSTHKHRPLVKPMMIVSTSGYIISVLGPYLADSKNSDAKILSHMIQTNVEDIRKWVEEDDIFIVDRGFRDAEALLDDLGKHVEMPSFLTRHSKQHSTEEANSTRFVTKLRWVVESVNGRLKTWNYLSRTIPNTQIPHIGDFVRIVSAICNKFRPDLSTGIEEEDVAMAAKMRFLANGVNELKDYVVTSGLEKRSIRWKKIDSHDVVFPHLTEEEIRQLTLGVYQIRLAKSYAYEHFMEGRYEIFISDDFDGILCAKIQSRHISAKKYLLWIRHDDISIKSWFCKCKVGTRVVGMCAHITSVIWFLGLARHEESGVCGVRDWCSSVEDAAALPIDESESEEENEERCSITEEE